MIWTFNFVLFAMTNSIALMTSLVLPKPLLSSTFKPTK
jgi:hypothetical protein